MGRTLRLATFLVLCSATQATLAQEAGLIGRWKLAGDARDSSGRGLHGESVGVDFNAPGPEGAANSAARFDGRKAVIRIPASPSLNLGTGDFTLAVWAHTEESLDDVLGDLVSKYDPEGAPGVELVHQERGGGDEQSGEFPQPPVRDRCRDHSEVDRPGPAGQRGLRHGDGGP